MLQSSLKVPADEVKPYQFSRKDGLVGLMDRGGSNLVRINEQFRESTGENIVRLIATTQPNHPDCRAEQRADKFGVPFVTVDFPRYEAKNDVQPGDYFWALKGRRDKIRSNLPTDQIIQIRECACDILDGEIRSNLESAGVKGELPQFGAGCMSLLGKGYVRENFVLNVHPGDLTKYSLNGTKRGERTIVGDGWIPPAKAISAGHEILYSSMHMMIPKTDAGSVQMRGYGLPIDYNWLLSRVNIKNKETLKLVGEAAQNALKYIGDHVIAGATFWDLFEGNWGMHESRVLAYRSEGEWYLVPNGIMIEDHVANNPNSVFKRSKEFIDEKVREFYSAVEKIGKSA